MKWILCSIVMVALMGCGNGQEKKPFSSDNEKVLIEGTIFKNDKIMLEIVGFNDKSQDDGEGQFIVKTKLSNLEQNKRIFSPKWSDSVMGLSPDSKVSSIEDEHGNYYLHMTSSMTSETKNVMPGKTIEDDLVFMQLVPSAKKLKMTLIGNEFTDGKDLVFNLTR